MASLQLFHMRIVCESSISNVSMIEMYSNDAFCVHRVHLTNRDKVMMSLFLASRVNISLIEAW